MTTRTKFFLILILSVCIGNSCFAENKKGVVKGATSVFVATDLHEQDTTLISLLANVLADTDAVVPSVVLLGGDYVNGSSGGGHGARPAMPDTLRHHSQHGHSLHGSDRPRPSSMHSSNTVLSISKITNEIDSVMTGNQHVDLFTYGSHDIGAKEGYGAFFSGPFTADGYYLYGVSYAQMIYDTPDTTYTGIDKNDARGYCAKTATECFDKWAMSLTDNKPIIIMSHVPIHALRNDNQGGERWYQAITKVAEKHDVLLLYGHNHTVEEGGRANDKLNYLLVPGDSIVTQGTVVKGEGHSNKSSNTYHHVLNFYYGNAGYIKNGYATLITLGSGNSGTMVLKRYSADGTVPAVIGDTDKQNPYTIKLKHE